MSLPTATEIRPPINTVAVVVDLVQCRGAIRIFKDDKRIGAVGTGEAGNRVIIPWDNAWWFRASGSLQAAYIIEKATDEAGGL